MNVRFRMHAADKHELELDVWGSGPFVRGDSLFFTIRHSSLTLPALELPHVEEDEIEFSLNAWNTIPVGERPRILREQIRTRIDAHVKAFLETLEKT